MMILSLACVIPHNTALSWFKISACFSFNVWLTQSENSSNLAPAWEPVELHGVLVLRVSWSLEPKTGW